MILLASQKSVYLTQKPPAQKSLNQPAPANTIQIRQEADQVSFSARSSNPRDEYGLDEYGLGTYDNTPRPGNPRDEYGLDEYGLGTYDNTPRPGNPRDEYGLDEYALGDTSNISRSGNINPSQSSGDWEDFTTQPKKETWEDYEKESPKKGGMFQNALMLGSLALLTMVAIGTVFNIKGNDSSPEVYSSPTTTPTPAEVIPPTAAPQVPTAAPTVQASPQVVQTNPSSFSVPQTTPTPGVAIEPESFITPETEPVVQATPEPAAQPTAAPEPAPQPAAQPAPQPAAQPAASPRPDSIDNIYNPLLIPGTSRYRPDMSDEEFSDYLLEELDNIQQREFPQEMEFPTLEQS